MKETAELSLTDKASMYMGTLGFMQGTFADTGMPYFAKKPWTDATGNAWLLVNKPLFATTNPEDKKFSYDGLKERMQKYIADTSSPVNSFSMAFLKDGDHFGRRNKDFKDLHDRGQYFDCERTDLFDVAVFLSEAEESMREDFTSEFLPHGKIIYFNPEPQFNRFTSETFEPIKRTGRFKQFYNINRSGYNQFFAKPPIPIDPHSTEYALVRSTE